MDGANWFLIIVGSFLLLCFLKSVYMHRWGATGRHTDYWWGELPPHGAVWFRRGVWYTMPRRDWAKPRLFDERSNPLDHEYRYGTVQVPPKMVQIPHEVEY